MNEKPRTRAEARARHKELMARIDAMEKAGPEAASEDDAVAVLHEILELIDGMQDLPPDPE